VRTIIEVAFEKSDLRSAIEGFFYAAARGGAEHPTECLRRWQAAPNLETEADLRSVITDS